MAETCLEDVLTTGQLLGALRERIASILKKPEDLTVDEARAHEQGIGDLLIHARSLVNSFHITLRTPAEVLGMISSYLSEDDLFSASQVCQHWRSVLTSFPSQWTRISCRRTHRMIASLERCGSVPIQLRVEPQFSNEILERVLLHGNVIASLTVDHHPEQLSQLQRLFALSSSSVERLHVYSEQSTVRGTIYQGVPQIGQDFPSLHELFVSRNFVPVDKLITPNLVHLALEHTADVHTVKLQSILDMLRGCPLLETLLLDYSVLTVLGLDRGCSPVRLPKLRTIEVGGSEVQSGLITYLRFAPNVQAGFRTIRTDDLCGNIPRMVQDSVQNVLTKVGVRRIILASAKHSMGHILLRIRFEGLQGSLEMTTRAIHNPAQPQDILLGPRGVIPSYSSHTENATELQVVGCFFHTDRGLDRVNAAMPNINTISFSGCGGPHVYKLLTSGNASSPPFPCLERVMVLGQESGLEKMARGRRDLGVPLKSLVIGRSHGDLKYKPLGDYTTLRELVGDLRTGCPVETLGWETGNEILSRWTTISDSVMLLFHQSRSLFRLYRFDVTRDDAESTRGGS